MNIRPYIRNTLIAGALAVSLFFAAVAVLLSAPDSRDAALVKVRIEEGQGLRGVARSLKSAGVIRSEFVFTVYVVFAGQQADLKAGLYNLSRDQSTPKVAAALSGGLSESEDAVVTIPEGMNIWETDARLAAAKLIPLGALAGEYLHKEGHLFPDTYRFKPGTSVEDIVRKMEHNFYEKTGNRGDLEVIVGSMLEKEARSADDMALVSGIIQKRMELGILLQIDATVAYGWCLRTAGLGRPCEVTQAPIVTEIKVDGPYNTYTNKGLPAGPISNPGLKALKAAANPQESDYLYYLSTRDGSKMIFSKTAAEHAANRRKHLGL